MPARDGAGGGAPPVLALRGVTKRFGDLVANDAIDLELRAGEIVALLGENGAGKTTLMNILFGRYVADEGRVLVEREGALAPLPPGSAAAALRAGIAMVHQHFTLAENLTALENVRLGRRPALRAREARRRVEALMAANGLRVPLDRPVARLSLGERQRVEILKALDREARVLILDEPTAVLAPQEADALFATLRGLAAEGLAVLLTSHTMREVLGVTDRVVVLRRGRRVAERATAETDAAELSRLMVGREVEVPARTRARPGEPLVELRDVATRGAGTDLAHVDLTLRSGEIVGVAGVSGNGQAALAALLAGLAAPVSGELRVRGEAVRAADPAAMIRRGVARMPEDRMADGVVGTMSVEENLVLERLPEPGVSRRGLLRRAAMRRDAEAAIEAFDIRCPGPASPARLMSGGNVQKLLLARTLSHGPRVVLANQPTRGLDVGATAEVHRRLTEAARGGAAVLMISEDLDELLAVADRIVVMREGRLEEAGGTEGLERARVGLMMAGAA